MEFTQSNELDKATISDEDEKKFEELRHKAKNFLDFLNTNLRNAENKPKNNIQDAVNGWYKILKDSESDNKWYEEALEEFAKYLKINLEKKIER